MNARSVFRSVKCAIHITIVGSACLGISFTKMKETGVTFAWRSPVGTMSFTMGLNVLPVPQSQTQGATDVNLQVDVRSVRKGTKWMSPMMTDYVFMNAGQGDISDRLKVI